MKQAPVCSKLEGEIAALDDLPRPDLIDRWQALHKSSPPKGLSRRLLILAIAYRMQVKRYGGLTPAVRRRLLKATNDGAPRTEARTSGAPKVAPGTRLIREWNGVTHEVDAVDDGFVWQGTRYGSLSVVARSITGARWSGPRFFGLTSEAVP